jgi:two-component system phosphate regulon sensor histidine kinase PhoR
MVANVSHELRTPLASIRLLTETLVSEPPPDAARRMLGQIDDELAALTQLVDELHELSQIESGRLALSMRPVPVPDLVASAMERLRPQAERHGLALHAEFPAGLPAVLVDKERLGQVLLNLLHNALKWTPAGGRIDVCACIATPQLDERTARELGRVDGLGWIKLSVRDTGIGIPTGETERIFERFYKVDRARTRDRGGTGLGLAIAKHIVEGHGGRIWAESQAGHSSTFSMLLPTA